MKNILIACECSQKICSKFRKLGFNVFSCDIKPTYGSLPDRHILGDVLPLLNGKCFFQTQDKEFHYVENWDLIIAHPPCDHLAVSGARWFKYKKDNGHQESAINFFLKFTDLDCPHICIENPISIMSSLYRKPDQIINPYQFGHPISKRTCLWLKGLPLLKPTKIVDIVRDNNGFTDSALKNPIYQGKSISWNNPLTKQLRSETFDGIASAMVHQWYEYI